MAHLFNRNILLGVSGGIAAYKAAELIRQLQERGANVRVIMTSGAQAFITPLTLQALSGHPVHTELLDEEAEKGMGHIELARWADLLIIAPATANVIARLSRRARRGSLVYGRTGLSGAVNAGACDEPANVGRMPATRGKHRDTHAARRSYSWTSNRRTGLW